MNVLLRCASFAALAALFVACSSQVVTQQSSDSTTGAASTTSGQLGSGGQGTGGDGTGPCSGSQCEDTATNATSTGPGAGGAGAGGESAGGGGGTFPIEGMVVAYESAPAVDQPAGGDTSELLLNVFFANNITCSDNGTMTFGCAAKGFAVVIPTILPVGDYDLSTMPSFMYSWAGSCADGGGGPEPIVQGTLSVTSSIFSAFGGSVTDVQTSSGPVAPFDFNAVVCVSP